ncbi:MAG: SIS domain-containing protein [Promethearchaeota archaeon]
MNKFLDEILSQAQALKNTAEFLKREENIININQFFSKLNLRSSRISFIGMGSSLFSCYIPYYLLQSYGFNVEHCEAGEYLFYFFPKVQNHTKQRQILFLTSQSGESGEIVELLKRIKKLKQSPKIIGITNDPNSTLASGSDYTFLIHAGKEESVTSKSYVCTLLLWYFMCKLYFINETYDQTFLDINTTISIIKKFLEDVEKIEIFYDNLISFMGPQFNHIEILTRGPSLSTAYQAALNYKEIVKKTSEANALSTFRHGGIECLNSGSKLIIISSDKLNLKLNVGFMKKLITNWEVGKILHITNQDLNQDDVILNNNPKILSFKHNISNPYLSPIMEIIILQLFFYKIAKKEGITPGEFRFSQKITREI